MLAPNSSPSVVGASGSDTATRGARLIDAADRRPLVVVALVAVMTALLTIPFLTMAPTESASTEPGGAVFEARDRLDDRFVSSVRPVLVIAEHASGDVLRAEPLRALAAAEADLRRDAEISPGLFEFYDSETDRQVDGVSSIVDLIERELDSVGVQLATATDAQVAVAANAVIAEYGERSGALGLSAQSTQDATGRWVVPALTMTVLTDDEVLGFGSGSVNFGGGTEVEEFDRAIQDVLRTADDFRVNGVAIDVNLTSEEQGAVAGPFIGFTILAVLLIVGLTFRSYWTLAIVGALLVLLIIWLKGISNLIGLEDDLVLSLIVPIAMVSFGVDFAFHSIGRYREERAEGASARPAVVKGLHAVSGALVLALASDSVAFLSNTTAGIESIVQFGVGAAIALAVAFLLLGFVAPLLVAQVERHVPVPTTGPRSVAVRVLGSLGAAALAMASVLLLVFILPWLGIVATALMVVVTLAVPFAIRRRRVDGVRVGDAAMSAGEGRLGDLLARIVGVATRRRRLVLGAAVLGSIGAATLAVQVPAEFDVEDYFAADTDFVVSLDQLETHVGDRGGEPATVYIEGDLTDPARLADLRAGLDQLIALDTDLVAKNDDGTVEVEAGVFEVFDETWASPVMVDIVQSSTGVAVSDTDADGIPDTREQVSALLDTATQIGVPIDAERLAMTPDDVGVLVDLSGTPATRFTLEITDSGSQSSVIAVQDAVTPIAEQIAADLGGSFVQVTGGPIVRSESLEATNRALSLSLPIAVVLCLIVSSVFLRSIRYGLASIAPILMVVTWLYAFMEVGGYAINLVTATIAAVSIGIGIDFAIHFIARYRDELAVHGRRDRAVAITSSGTGTALAASAFSSSVGFGILALAPMPLFASYGLLTAIMIAMALVATLLVLPCILFVITKDATT